MMKQYGWQWNKIITSKSQFKALVISWFVILLVVALIGLAGHGDAQALGFIN